jgi:hypothetical protein
MARFSVGHIQMLAHGPGRKRPEADPTAKAFVIIFLAARYDAPQMAALDSERRVP